MNNSKMGNHFMINDGLNEMAANAVEYAVDRITGIVYAVYLTSDAEMGESNKLVKIAKFNIMQPTNIEWVTVFDREIDFSGHRLSECNIIELNDSIVRVYAIDLETRVYYYKDVEKKGLNVGPLHGVKFKEGEHSQSVGLSLANVNTFITSMGAVPFKTLTMTTGIIKLDGYYYSILCSENTQSILFVKSLDGETWTCQSIINHKANHETMLAYHDSKFWVICRNGYTKETTETKQNLMYSEDGINWKQSNLALTTSDTRPYLFTYQGNLCLAYSSPMPEDYSTVRPWRCNIHVGKIVSVNGEETFEEIVYKESKFGIVYYVLLDWYGRMVMLYSSGELHPTEGLMEGWSSGKDCLNYTILYSQEPELLFD